MKIFRIPLSIGVLISILLVLIISVISINTLVNFYNYKNKVCPNMELTPDSFHLFLNSEIKKEWMKVTAPTPAKDEESPLRTFHISIDQEDLNTLNSNLPESGKSQYVDAYMQTSDDNIIRKVKLRYRGDNNYHWLYKQKSLRIKLYKSDIYNMEKKFNLINPPHWFAFRDVIVCDIAKELGLISPDYFPVRVFINNKYMGVYIYLSQVDESLLRKHKIMPGSIYSGDYAPPNSNGVSALWDDEKYWLKKSSRNSEQKSNRKDIKYFINAINNYNELDFYKFVNRMMDKGNMYNYMALDVLFGTDHHDFHHNHKIYFDPYRGKFRQIEYDLRNWIPAQEKDISNYPLLQRIKLNPILEAERDRNIYKLLNSPYFDINNIEQRYSNINALVSNDLMADFNFDGAKNFTKIIGSNWLSVPVNYKTYMDNFRGEMPILKERIKYLHSYYNTTSISYDVIEKLENGYKVLFKVTGNSPAKLKFKNNSDTKIFKLFDGKRQPVKNFVILYPGKKIIKNGQVKYNKYLLGTDTIVESPLLYTFIINNVRDINDFIEKHIAYSNDITGDDIYVSENKIYINDGADLIHPWSLPQQEEQFKILEGVISVNKTLVFDGYTSVSIKPGTTFLLDENSSIYFYGKVTALGTKEKPIKFIAKNPNKPWGIVAVQGQATTGSKFEYVEFENGSVDSRNLINYTSPFNIHDMDWFEVRHCKIGANFVGDDGMHIAYAKGIVDNCEFYDARSDSLDIDIADVSVINNIFYNSGNDGLDVMTTKMEASNNVFIETGDKGISVGEWSDVEITDSLFLQTVIGLEIKDKSKVKANNLVFIDSKEKAINLYNKNKRYDEGGFLDAETIYLAGNTKVTADKYSNGKIENRIEDELPEFTGFRWYKNKKNLVYEQMINNAEMKYAH